MCKKMQELVFEAEKTDRGWTYRQLRLNVGKLEAERIIEQACKKAIPMIQVLIRKKVEKEKAKKKYLKRVKNSRGK